MIGGEPLGKDVVMWWNYVGYHQQEIVQAEQDWDARSSRFGEIPQWQGERLQGPRSPWRR
ncbi:pirin-like C-terminal cupin domain-containing protein [Marinobacter similis]|uniref:pirin-like C-terminal cupin domain-containing protein n=1 Tax=Marinobacter similis TaxID=1420916 RepID=UPI001F46D459|nr:pirin-like C-terminal cupin domain-containing protein [Marinobacter similis]